MRRDHWRGGLLTLLPLFGPPVLMFVVGIGVMLANVEARELLRQYWYMLPHFPLGLYLLAKLVLLRYQVAIGVTVCVTALSWFCVVGTFLDPPDSVAAIVFIWLNAIYWPGVTLLFWKSKAIRAFIRHRWAWIRLTRRRSRGLPRPNFKLEDVTEPPSLWQLAIDRGRGRWKLKSLKIPTITAEGVNYTSDPEVYRQFWTGVLAMALRDGATSIHFQPWHNQKPFWYMVGYSRYDLVPPPTEIGKWLVWDAQMLGPEDGRLRNPYLVKNYSRRLCLESPQYGLSEWVMIVWSVGELRGVEFYRLDGPAVPDPNVKWESLNPPVVNPSKGSL